MWSLPLRRLSTASRLSSLSASNVSSVVPNQSSSSVQVPLGMSSLLSPICGSCQNVSMQNRSISTTHTKFGEEPKKESKKIKLKTKSSETFRIYTRTGDQGTSSLFTGERREKNDAIFEALGTTDELSSHLGLCIEYTSQSNHPFTENLQRIQCILQDVGSAIATPSSSARQAHVEKTGFNKRHTDELEEWIDHYSTTLPPLENFILPGGGKTSASLHIARSVCRRAERQLAPLAKAEEIDPEVFKYVNRLSDFLFTVARLAARLDKKEETIYVRPDNRDKDSYVPGPDGVWKKEKSKKKKE